MPPQGRLLAFPSEVHLHPRKITVYPWKIIREEPTSYTYPSFWLSPKCKVVIEPTSIFHLPDSGNCFHKRMRNSTVLTEVARDWK